MNSHTINYSTAAEEKGLIVHTTVTIGYDVPWKHVHELLINAALDSECILKDPAPFVGVAALADSSVNLATRAWVSPENYWPVFFDMNQKVYNQFNSKGISIPFPQMDVHMHNNSK